MNQLLSKTCRKCTVLKEVSEYYPRESVCKECRIAKQKEYYNENKEAKKKYIQEWSRRNPEKRKASQAKRKAADPERFKDYSAKHRMKVRYGITLDDYKKLFAEQEGLCAICSNPETTLNKDGTVKRLALDHCHKTNMVRCLLCDSCNRGLGAFRDSPELLMLAAHYLDRCREPMKI